MILMGEPQPGKGRSKGEKEGHQCKWSKRLELGKEKESLFIWKETEGREREEGREAVQPARESKGILLGCWIREGNTDNPRAILSTQRHL